MYWLANVGFLYFMPSVAVTPMLLGRLRRACAHWSRISKRAIECDSCREGEREATHGATHGLVENGREQPAVDDALVAAQAVADMHDEDALLLVGRREDERRHGKLARPAQGVARERVRARRGRGVRAREGVPRRERGVAR